LSVALAGSDPHLSTQDAGYGSIRLHL